MRKQLTAVIDNLISFLLLIIAGATPLLFLNQTTEFYEMPKLVFLVVSTMLIAGLWIFSWILKGKVQITRTPLDIPLLLLLGSVLVSTYFSDSRYQSIYGNFPRVHGSAISWVVYILLYFVTVSNLKNMLKIKTFSYVLYGSAVAVALISLLSFFGVYLPFDFARTANFTPSGSTFSTIALLLMLLPLPLLSIVSSNKFMPMPIALAVSIIFGVTIALTGSIPTYIALAVVFILCFLITKPHKNARFRKALPMFLTPLVVVALTLVLAYLPFPGNKIQELESAYPKEIQLPFSISWKISASAFRDAPLIGTGPATYLFDFTNYKPLEFNLLEFWNFNFDTAYNEFLQIWGTLGLLGLLAAVIVCLVVLNNTRRNLSVRHVTEDETFPALVPAFAIGSLVGLLLLALHVTTLVSLVGTLLVFALLMVSQGRIREKVMSLSMGLKASTANDKQFDLLPIIVFVVFVVAAVPVFYQTYTATAADYWHRQALLQATKSGNLTYTYLQRAESLNPVIDLYRIDMAQTNFALANAIATQKGPTAENPNGTLTDQDRTTIQTLLSQAINEGRVAVALSPLSARNWEVLAAIYRNITGVAQNALTFSLDAYGRAIQRDPLNPALRISVGGIYYTAGNYDLAIRFFSDAANLKPDNANAYYNLSVALRDKGDLQNAKLVADRAVTLLADNKDSQGYKVATDLVAELVAKISNNDTEAGGTGKIQDGATQSNLPEVDVDNLDNPPTPATPAAVRRNPNANLPQLTTPTPGSNR
ncbi:MAG: O-antigen ligase family protein [Candidatus Levybacteria bacterium]|nr:O-antigen ligase family protein [Candidatus Levybacteria bacterium]